MPPRDPKHLSFSNKLKKLGVVADTEKAGKRTVQLGRTPERSSELFQNIDGVLDQNQASTKTLEKLHGRIVSSSTFVFGRKLNAATRTISWFSRRPFLKVNLETTLKMASRDLKHHLAESKKVSISRDLNEI